MGSFIEENHEYKMAGRANEKQGPPRRGPPLEVMQFWGIHRAMPTQKQALAHQS